MPFTGSSGELLWRLLGLSRQEVYVTNVRKDFSDYASVPTPGEITEALPVLRGELAATTANLFVACGAQALKALTGLDSIEAWRGSVVPCTLVPGRKVLATLHPAHALRDWPSTYIIERDLRRARRECLYPDIRRVQRDFTINADLQTTVDYLHSLGDPISVDIETIGFDYPTCVGISDSATRAICIPFRGGRLSPSELAYVWRLLYRVFLSRGIIGQNIQFDLTRLERYGFRFPRIHFDTMLAHHLLYPEFAHDLGFITSIYTPDPYYKHESSTNLWEYNCKDACLTYVSYEGLLKELIQVGQLDYYNEHVMGLIRPIMAMQSSGFVIDKEGLEKTRRRYDLEREYLQLQLEQMVGFDINVKSPPDLRKLLHEILHLPKLKVTKTGQASTDEDTLRGLAYKYPDHADVFTKVIDVRERRTMLSGFLSVVPDDDGRYRADYLIHGTKSGRLSSRGKGKGPQLQNIPMRARRMFVAAAGRKLLQGDLKRAEAQFVAFDSLSKTLQKLYTTPGLNPYCEFGTRVMGKPVLKSDELMYKTFKTVTHATNYGMQWKRLIMQLRLAGVNIEDLVIRGVYGAKRKAEFLIESYHEMAPELRAFWHPKIRDIVRAGRCVHDAFGRRRLFLDRMDDDLFRKAYAQRPQASIVGVTNKGLRTLHNMGIAPLAQVHDSIVLEVPEDQVYENAVILERVMTTEVETWGGMITLGVELKSGDNWQEMEELDEAIVEQHRRSYAAAQQG
jgi:uracil-DNA glycosylase family 4